MKKLILQFLRMLVAMVAIGQKNPEEQAIVDEGMKLYRSEMASWNGTDIFLEKYSDKKDRAGGYFSYGEGENVKCIFFSDAATPVVLITITFDSSFNKEAAMIDPAERGFTAIEQELYEIRKKALELISEDDLFRMFKGTNLNLVPLIEGSSKKVFVLTAPQENGYVLFGNDYLIVFDQKNKVKSKKALHKNLIPQEFGKGDTSIKGDVVGGVHNHLKETGDLITSTDICTLMLYAKSAGWKTYTVVGENSISMWDCGSHSLAVLPKGVSLKIKQ